MFSTKTCILWKTSQAEDFTIGKIEVTIELYKTPQCMFICNKLWSPSETRFPLCAVHHMSVIQNLNKYNDTVTYISQNSWLVKMQNRKQWKLLNKKKKGYKYMNKYVPKNTNPQTPPDVMHSMCTVSVQAMRSHSSQCIKLHRLRCGPFQKRARSSSPC